MHGSSSPNDTTNAVVVQLIAGKYVVRVFENGELVERDFLLEAHAHSWAQGQRIRLGLVHQLI